MYKTNKSVLLFDKNPSQNSSIVETAMAKSGCFPRLISEIFPKNIPAMFTFVPDKYANGTFNSRFGRDASHGPL